MNIRDTDNYWYWKNLYGSLGKRAARTDNYRRVKLRRYQKYIDVLRKNSKSKWVRMGRLATEDEALKLLEEVVYLLDYLDQFNEDIPTTSEY